MPDPALYLQAIVLAAGAGAVCVLALGGVRRPAGAARLNAGGVLGIVLGLALGGAVLQLPLRWPPTSALSRWLAVVLPAVVGVELLAGCERVPRWLGWSLRLGLAASTGRILLHDSVYLAGPKGEWPAWQAGLVLVLCGAALAFVWGMLSWLSARTPGVSIPLVLSLAILGGGAAIMLAGYLAGGEAAMVLAAALAGAAIAASLFGARSAPQGMIGIGVVGLFSMLIIGRFFGRLSTGAAVAMLLTPLLCWATEAPLLADRKPWLKGAIRLALAAIPLAVMLAAAKIEFDRGTAPLLGGSRSPHP